MVRKSGYAPEPSMNPKPTKRISRPPAAALGAAVLLALGATVAIAFVKVYSNDFSNKDEANQLRISGKGCKQLWDEDNKRIVALAKAGPTRCRLKVPVQGDAPQPNQAVQVTSKLEKNIANSVAKKVYISISVRDGAGGRYEFKVFPALRRAELAREPNANGFPMEVKDKGIGKAGERNTLRLEVNGDEIKWKVNKKKFETFADENAGELEGRRITLTLGVEGKTGEPVSAWFDDLQVTVPDPK
jgi:hypothetical protein